MTVRRMLTRRQAAEYLGVSCSWLSRQAALRGGPPFVKLGDGPNAAVRYPTDLMDEYIAARTKAPKE